jgi:hypothetical protein
LEAGNLRPFYGLVEAKSFYTWQDCKGAMMFDCTLLFFDSENLKQYVIITGGEAKKISSYS